jgi:hypothetical protein
MKVIAKKKSKLVSYELYRVRKGIYAVKVDEQYQRAMLFLRYQEYYESPYKQFQGKNFDIFEFMDFYRKDRGVGCFTYTRDWSGYNIPSDSLNKCIKGVFDVKVTTTPYDSHMFDIKWSITEDIKTYRYPDPSKEKFYLIGVDKVEGDIMDHEIAHAMFYLYPEYKKEMTALVRALPASKFKGLKKILLDLGYREKVIDDEIQAFMSTGLWDAMHDLKFKDKELEGFEAVFKKYAEL